MRGLTNVVANGQEVIAGLSGAGEKPPVSLSMIAVNDNGAKQKVE